MTLSRENNKVLAGVRTRTLPTTFVFAALIFGIAGLSALWLLIVAGSAALLAIGIGLLNRLSARRSSGGKQLVNLLMF
jgi:hypothetical protein